MNKNKTGLIFGSYVAFFHLIWIIMVALGLGQLFLDFIMDIHLVYNPFLVAPFSLARSLVLLIVTFIIGYIFGYAFAYVWNKFCKKDKTPNPTAPAPAPAPSVASFSAPVSTSIQNNQN